MTAIGGACAASRSSTQSVEPSMPYSSPSKSVKTMSRSGFQPSRARAESAAAVSRTAATPETGSTAPFTQASVCAPTTTTPASRRRPASTAVTLRSTRLSVRERVRSRTVSRVAPSRYGTVEPSGPFLGRGRSLHASEQILRDALRHGQRGQCRTKPREGATRRAVGISRSQEIAQHRAALHRPRVQVRPGRKVRLDDPEIAALRVKKESRGTRFLRE